MQPVKTVDEKTEWNISIPTIASVEKRTINNLMEAIYSNKGLDMSETVFITSFSPSDREFNSKEEWTNFTNLVNNLGSSLLVEFLVDNKMFFEDRGKLLVKFNEPIPIIRRNDILNGQEQTIFKYAQAISIDLEWEFCLEQNTNHPILLEIKGKIVDIKYSDSTY